MTRLWMHVKVINAIIVVIIVNVVNININVVIFTTRTMEGELTSRLTRTPELRQARRL